MGVGFGHTLCPCFANEHLDKGELEIYYKICPLERQPSKDQLNKRVCPYLQKV